MKRNNYLCEENFTKHVIIRSFDVTLMSWQAGINMVFIVLFDGKSEKETKFKISSI